MIGLIYLAWAPLGLEPLRGFLDSYHAHDPGIDHDLVVVLNGLGLPPAPQAARALTVQQMEAELASTRHRLIVLEEPMLDLAAYGASAQLVQHEHLCFLNSYSEILCERWLAKLARWQQAPGVGLVGATGSWESKSKLAAGNLSHWAFQLGMLPASRYHYPAFPNPHIRTTAFMAERRLLVGLGLERAYDKPSAYLLESGRHSITRQIQALGMQALVVGCDGKGYEVSRWPSSHTFRSGRQQNLLVADNRTRQWEQASRMLTWRLSRYAWGSKRYRAFFAGS